MTQTKISATQLFFLIFNVLISGMMASTAGIEVGQDAWLANLLGLAICLGFALVYVIIANRFPGQTLITINDTVWGPFFGKAVSFGYLLYYLLVFFLRVYLIIASQQDILPATPPGVHALIITGLAMLMVICGLEVIARCSMIIRIVIIPVWLLLVLLNLPEVQLSNFLPVMQTPFSKIILAALQVSALGFNSGFAFLMIFPAVVEPCQLHKTVSLAFATVGVYIMTGIIFTWGTLGPSAAYFRSPITSATRLINIGDVFTRMDIITAIILWLSYMISNAIFSYILVTAFGELLKLKNPLSLTLPFMILTSLLSTHSASNSGEVAIFVIQIWTLLTAPFQYLLPLLTLIMAFIRKPPRQKANSEKEY